MLALEALRLPEVLTRVEPPVTAFAESLEDWSGVSGLSRFSVDWFRAGSYKQPGFYWKEGVLTASLLAVQGMAGCWRRVLALS